LLSGAFLKVKMNSEKIVLTNGGSIARLVEVMLGQASLECKCDISFKFLKAQTLSEAFDVADKDGPNVILLDLGLPDSSGVDTVKKVIERLPGIPVIAHTGMDDIRTGMEATRLGEVGYMVKGESTPSLLAKNILFALEQYKLKNELEKKRIILVGIDRKRSNSYFL